MKPKRSRPPLSQRGPMAECRAIMNRYRHLPEAITKLTGTDPTTNCGTVTAVFGRLMPTWDMVAGVVLFNDNPTRPIVMSHTWLRKGDVIYDPAIRPNSEYGVPDDIEREYLTTEEFRRQFDMESPNAINLDQVAEYLMADWEHARDHPEIVAITECVV